MENERKDFAGIRTVEELKELVAYLRSPQGCPWDREQTARSLKPYLLEEVYELLEAIESDDPVHLCEELGDVLMHLCFQVCLAEAAGRFGLPEVVALIRDKMVRRHPHVFAGARFASREDQLFAWEQIKQGEKEEAAKTNGESNPGKSVLDGLPRSLPPLLKSYRIQGRVSKYRFDWSGPLEVFDKVEEEVGELRQAVAAGQRDGMEEEIGDLLFSVVNLARLLEVHPKLALERTNAKFVRRFKALEKKLRQRGLKLGALPLEELDKVWDEVKREERGQKAPEQE
ncbi:nucleoside triphosphate pyrophosphohydrolase [bacterium]|nr:nucleoside triphosphate pyrophosphohydrolase [bacterium]